MAQQQHKNWLTQKPNKTTNQPPQPLNCLKNRLGHKTLAETVSAYTQKHWMYTQNHFCCIWLDRDVSKQFIRLKCTRNKCARLWSRNNYFVSFWDHHALTPQHVTTSPHVNTSLTRLLLLWCCWFLLFFLCCAACVVNIHPGCNLIQPLETCSILSWPCGMALCS